MPRRSTPILLIASVAMLTTACMEPNPSWLGPKEDTVVTYDTGGHDFVQPPTEAGPVDLGPGQEGIQKDGPFIPPPDLKPWQDIKPWPDVKPWPDQKPWPDSQPWVCTKDSDCDDKLNCTTDKCLSNKCENKLLSGNCKIGTLCYKKDDANPNNSCQVCDPGIFPLQWSPLADGVPCASDGLSCTSDMCGKGICEHKPTGGGCIIGGKCIPEGGASPQDACSACIGALNPVGYTAADGLPCSPGAGKPGMCMAKKCRGFTEGTWGVSKAITTSFRSVDMLPSDKSVWAVGHYQETPQAAEKGLLIKVSDLAASKPPATKLTSAPMGDVHGDMAVGYKGQALRYSKGAWAADTAIETALGGEDRWAVWTGGNAIYMAGPQGTKAQAMMVCAVSSTGTPTCANHKGVSAGRGLGRLFGTLAPTGLGPLWSVVVGTNQPEDIYFNPGTGDSWSTNAPTGCHDSGNNPCANTSWNTYDLDGGGPDDVWVVGGGSGLLRYDGKAWKKITNVFYAASQLDLYAVYSSKKDNLVTVAGVRNNSGATGRQVQLYNYNRKLDAWFGPVVLYKGQHNTPAYMLDIGGPDYNGLWMVGQKEVTSSGTQSVQGWVMKLQ